MSSPERYLNALKELRYKHSFEALNPGAQDKTAFGYGKACGIAQGLELAEQLFDSQTAQEETERDGQSNRKR